MHQINFFMTILLAVLTGLLPATSGAEQTDISSMARVRVYQEADITLFPGEYCYGSNSTKAVRNFSTSFWDFSLRKRLDMPQTDDIPGAYNEYQIEAGKPLTVMLQFAAEQNGVRASCGPLGATFYPQAGRDYDITMGVYGSCFVQVRELYPVSPGKAGARLFPAGYSFACGNK